MTLISLWYRNDVMVTVACTIVLDVLSNCIDTLFPWHWYTEPTDTSVPLIPPSHRYFPGIPLILPSQWFSHPTETRIPLIKIDTCFYSTDSPIPSKHPSYVESAPLFASHAHTTSTSFLRLSLRFPPLPLSLGSFLSYPVELSNSTHQS